MLLTGRMATHCRSQHLPAAQASDAILFGAVGDFSLDTLPQELRPEQAILGLRKALNLFANFRPAMVYPELVGRIEPEAGDCCRSGYFDYP